MIPSTHSQSSFETRLYSPKSALPAGKWGGVLLGSILLGSVLLGCSAPQTNGGVSLSPENQSIAQYDIARDLWLTRGQTREALNHVLDSIELDNENAEAEHLAALIFMDFCQQDRGECHFDRVEKHARRALDLKSDFLEARNTLGVALIHQDRPQQAVEVLRPLAENILYKTPENAWGNLGWAYLKLKQPEQALVALTRSVTAQPQFCVGFYRLGLAHEALKSYEEAQAAYTQALNSAEGHCQGLQVAYAGRARVLIALQQPVAAASDLKTCTKLNQNTDAGRECDLLQSRMAP